MNLMSGKYLLNQAARSPEFFDDVQSRAPEAMRTLTMGDNKTRTRANWPKVIYVN